MNMWWNKTQTIELSITLNVGWHLQNREFKIKGQCDQDLAPIKNFNVPKYPSLAKSRKSFENCSKWL